MHHLLCYAWLFFSISSATASDQSQTEQNPLSEDEIKNYKNDFVTNILNFMEDCLRRDCGGQYSVASLNKGNSSQNSGNAADHVTASPEDTSRECLTNMTHSSPTESSRHSSTADSSQQNPSDAPGKSLRTKLTEYHGDSIPAQLKLGKRYKLEFPDDYVYLLTTMHKRNFPKFFEEVKDAMHPDQNIMSLGEVGDLSMTESRFQILKDTALKMTEVVFGKHALNPYGRSRILHDIADFLRSDSYSVYRHRSTPDRPVKESRSAFCSRFKKLLMRELGKATLTNSFDRITSFEQKVRKHYDENIDSDSSTNELGNALIYGNIPGIFIAGLELNCQLTCEIQRRLLALIRHKASERFREKADRFTELLRSHYEVVPSILEGTADFNVETVHSLKSPNQNKLSSEKQAQFQLWQQISALKYLLVKSKDTLSESDFNKGINYLLDLDVEKMKAIEYIITRKIHYSAYSPAYSPLTDSKRSVLAVGDDLSCELYDEIYTKDHELSPGEDKNQRTAIYKTLILIFLGLQHLSQQEYIFFGSFVRKGVVSDIMKTDPFETYKNFTSSFETLEQLPLSTSKSLVANPISPPTTENTCSIVDGGTAGIRRESPKSGDRNNSITGGIRSSLELCEAICVIKTAIQKHIYLPKSIKQDLNEDLRTITFDFFDFSLRITGRIWVCYPYQEKYYFEFKIARKFTSDSQDRQVPRKSCSDLFYRLDSSGCLVDKIIEIDETLFSRPMKLSNFMKGLIRFYLTRRKYALSGF